MLILCYAYRMELAWAAGFIDGEGTFGIQRQKERKDILYLQAGQVDRFVLDRLQEALELGKVYGPYKAKKIGWSEYYYFRLTGNEKVKQAFGLLCPWLSPQKTAQYFKSLEG